MSYRYSKNQTNGEPEIIIDGWEKGIASSPHKGLASLKAVNISTESGEVMCSFGRVLQTQTGTTGTLTQVNTNTVSVSGITLLVGQIITITNAGTTGLSGNYYYLSTGKLVSGSIVPSDPVNATVVTGITAGSATFSITYPLGSPIQSATETYLDGSNVTQYRYYILDSLGSVWCHDSATLSGIDTPLWFFIGNVGAGASGLAVYNGWITVANGYTIYWKISVLLGSAFASAVSGSVGFESMASHSMLSGHSGTLYGTDGNKITSMFADTSLVSGFANIQSYASWTGSTGSNVVTNGGFTGSAAGWTLTSGWAYGTNNVIKGSDGVTTLAQTMTGNGLTGFYLTFTVSAISVGSFTPSIGAVAGTAVTTAGTFTQYIVTDISGGNLIFTPSSTSRFTLTNISMVSATYVASIISGFAPTDGTFGNRVPATFFTTGTLPTAIVSGTIYYIEWALTHFKVFAAASGGSELNLTTSATGKQYFNTFNPVSAGGSATLIFTSQRLTLPTFETAQCMAEVGATVIIGGKGNVLYPWDQLISTITANGIIPLPENNTVNLVTVNNVCYVFTGQKGNIYITNGSSASLVLSVPDFMAGIPGTPSSYIEPYFVWGGGMYMRGRVWFSILDQTSIKAGNCGGTWSFVPSQNFSTDQDSSSLRVENQSSYGTYSGVSLVLLADQNQLAVGPKYWNGWYSSISGPTYGIDYSNTVPAAATTTFETDLIPTGTFLQKMTFKQIEYKLSCPLAVGETITMSYRQNANASYTALPTFVVESTTGLSGYVPVSFQKGQWLQLQVALNCVATSGSSFVRLKEIIIR